MKILTQSFALILTTLISYAAQAEQYENISLPGVTVYDSQTKTVSLEHARYVRNLIIQAEGVGGEGAVEVMVNGIVKGSLQAPGRDPSYIVTIGETTRSIQFRHRSGQTVRILDIQATVSVWQGRPDQDPVYHGSASDAIKLAREIISIVDSLKPFISPKDEGQYLLPIKNQANYVLIYLDVRGENSLKAHRALAALIDQVDFAKPFIEELLQTGATFDLAVDLLTAREKIDELLD